MPTGFYIRTAKHKKALNVPHKGSGKYKRKPFTEEHRKNISKAKKGKTYCEIFGTKKAKELKKFLSKHFSRVNKGKKVSDETKIKMRISAIQRIEKNHGQCWPNYNKKACELFRIFDKANNTKGRYAVYGDGEHHIKELGYFPDYINFDKKLIIEYDEPGHFDKTGNYKISDLNREKEIKNYFSDFRLIRLAEREDGLYQIEKDIKPECNFINVAVQEC